MNTMCAFALNSISPKMNAGASPQEEQIDARRGEEGENWGGGRQPRDECRSLSYSSNCQTNQPTQNTNTKHRWSQVMNCQTNVLPPSQSSNFVSLWILIGMYLAGGCTFKNIWVQLISGRKKTRIQDVHQTCSLLKKSACWVKAGWIIFQMDV